MSTNRAYLSLFLCTLFGCAAGNKDVRSDISRLEDSLTDLRGIQAEQTTELAALRSDLRRLNGRLEEFEHKSGQSAQSPAVAPSPVPSRPPPPGVPIDFLEADEIFSTSMPVEAGQRFKEALFAVREGNFRGALNILEHSLKVSPQETWAPQVLFWVGVSYDNLGEPRRAVTAYHELSATFPKHSRAPAALLRQATSFQQLNDKETAKLSLEKLIRQYPRTSEATAARKRLQSM